MSRNLVTQPILSTFFDRHDDTVLAWLGMAGALINAQGTILLIDPLLSVVERDGQVLCESEFPLKVPLPIEAQDLPRVDAVLYTHADEDHFGRVTAQFLAERFDCPFIAPPPVLERLADLGVSLSRRITARDDDVLRLGDVDLMVTPALHNWQGDGGWRRGEACGYLIRSPDGVIWHPGDTRLIPELMAIRDVDVLFFDVAAVDAHLGPAGSAQIAATSGAKVLIAYHYGTFDLPPGSFANCDPDDALPYIAGLSARFLQLNPGELLELPLTRTLEEIDL